jgi:hypothetical protein
MLLVSELGASRTNKTRGTNFILDLWSRGEWDRFDYTHAQKHFSWMHRVSKKVEVLNELFPSSYSSAFNPKECGRFGCRGHPKKD